jgi:hypothetical protein
MNSDANVTNEKAKEYLNKSLFQNIRKGLQEVRGSIHGRFDRYSYSSPTKMFKDTLKKADPVSINILNIWGALFQEPHSDELKSDSKFNLLISKITAFHTSKMEQLSNILTLHMHLSQNFSEAFTGIAMADEVSTKFSILTKIITADDKHSITLLANEITMLEKLYADHDNFTDYFTRNENVLSINKNIDVSVIIEKLLEACLNPIIEDRPSSQELLEYIDHLIFLNFDLFQKLQQQDPILSMTQLEFQMNELKLDESAN